MFKAVVGGLLAAAAVIAPTAMAQDRDHGGWRGGRGGQGEARGPAPQQRQAPSPQANAAPRPQAAPPQAQPRPQGRPDFRGGGWQQRQAPAGVFNGGAQFDPRARAQAEAGRPDRQAWQGGRPDRGPDAARGWQGGDRQGGDWRGNRPQGVFNGEAQARAAADARARADRDRRWDGNRGGDWNRGGYDRGQADWRGGRRDDHRYDDRRAWNRGWRNDNRYDWNRYRAQNRYAYRLPRYYAPYGWNYGYRRFSIGVTLSRALWAQDYWIDDPYAYRLPEVYGPYRWVRYYNDALLVDTYSGQVVDVIYGIFW